MARAVGRPVGGYAGYPGGAQPQPVGYRVERPPVAVSSAAVNQPAWAVAQPAAPARPAYYIVNGVRYDDYAAAQDAVRGAATQQMSLVGLDVKDMFTADNRARLNRHIKQLFAQYAGADKRLQTAEMQALADSLAVELRIPKDVFGDLNFMFWRYDFSGDGELDEEEGILLIENMLRTYADSKSSAPPDCPQSVIPLKRVEDSYDIVKKLGQGGQGAVYLATDKSNQQQRVVKYYDKKSDNMDMADIVAEVELLTKKLDHPKIARIYEFFQDRENIYVVSEPYFGGDLTTVIDKGSEAGVQVTYGWMAAILKQACEGVAFLHTKSVMHCDLKEPNVMVSGKSNWEAPNVVVIDFGLAKSFSSEGMMGGTPGYMPPEVWEFGLWTPKGDTFAMGVMFWKMISGTIPIGATACTIEDIQYETINLCLPDPPPQQLSCQPLLLSLVRRMLSRDFHSRPVIAKVLQDPWFTSVIADQTELDDSAVKAMASIKKKHDLHTALLADLASRENLAQLEEISNIFVAMDADNDGRVSADEARRGLAGKLPSQQLEEMITALMGPDGEVRYTRFMGEMMAAKCASNTDMLWRLFQELDTDGSSYLDIHEIQAMLQRPAVSELMEGRTATDLMTEMDHNNSGRVSWPEFRDTLIPRRRKRALYTVGQNVEYYSTTHNQWVPTQVEQVDEESGAIIIPVKPGFWLKLSEQAQRIRPAAPGDACQAKKGGAARQALAGALGC